MSVDDLLEEQEDLTNAKPIPYKLQVHIRCFATPSVTVKPAVIKSITQLTETYVIFVQHYDEKDNFEWTECPIWKNGSLKNVSTNNILAVNF